MMPDGTDLIFDWTLTKGLDESYYQILDEADHFLLDSEVFDSKPQWKIFGITATPIKRDICVEQQFMETLGFTVIDSTV